MVTKVGRVRAREAAAAARVRSAAADYDATPEGVAEVQAALDEARLAARAPAESAEQPGAAPVVSVLERRRSLALDRMNGEAAERSARWGSAAVEYVPVERGTDPPLSHALTATSKRYAPANDKASGRPYVPYEVTLRRRSADGRKKTMRVSYRADPDAPPPTQTEVLERMTALAARYDAVNGDWALYVAAHTGPGESPALCRSEFNEARRYRDQLHRFFTS